MIGGLRLFLILLLVLTSQSLATARVQPRPAGEIVICAGGAITTIAIDQNGNPVEKVQFCPDMAFNVLAAVSSDAPPMLLGQTLFTLDRSFDGPVLPGRAAPAARARDPPPFA